MGYSTGFWQDNAAKTKKSSPIRLRIFITFDLGGKNTNFLTIAAVLGQDNRPIETYLNFSHLTFFVQKISWKSVEKC